MNLSMQVEARPQQVTSHASAVLLRSLRHRWSRTFACHQLLDEGEVRRRLTIRSLTSEA